MKSVYEVKESRVESHHERFCALHYCVLGFLGSCVFALYTKHEKLKMI
ncbi:MAG: hypothetical protein AB1765_13345 [Candidatus Hydrogenedentota bacterium]